MNVTKNNDTTPPSESTDDTFTQADASQLNSQPSCPGCDWESKRMSTREPALIPYINCLYMQSLDSLDESGQSLKQAEDSFKKSLFGLYEPDEIRLRRSTLFDELDSIVNIRRGDDDNLNDVKRTAKGCVSALRWLNLENETSIPPPEAQSVLNTASQRRTADRLKANALMAGVCALGVASASSPAKIPMAIAGLSLDTTMAMAVGREHDYRSIVSGLVDSGSSVYSYLTRPPHSKECTLASTEQAEKEQGK